MEEKKNASVLINLREGSVEISGSESFVEKNMEVVFAFVEKTIKHRKEEPQNQLDADEPLKQMDPIEEEALEVPKEDKNKYKKLGIYSVDEVDGILSIHRKIPGANNAEKMKNVALIVLYEKDEPVASSVIKTLCEKQACWDSSNASSIFERDIVNFIKKKISKQKWTIELTINGKEAAVALLEEMVNDKK